MRASQHLNDYRIVLPSVSQSLTQSLSPDFVPDMQAAVRARIGEGVTAFTRIEDGVRSVAVGDNVRLAVRPALVGVVQHFIVHQARPRRP